MRRWLTTRSSSRPSPSGSEHSVWCVQCSAFGVFSVRRVKYTGNNVQCSPEPSAKHCVFALCSARLCSVFRESLRSCVDAGESYEDRVARRKEEIESLQEALRILNGEDVA